MEMEISLVDMIMNEPISVEELPNNQEEDDSIVIRILEGTAAEDTQHSNHENEFHYEERTNTKDSTNLIDLEPPAVDGSLLASHSEVQLLKTVGESEPQEEGLTSAFDDSSCACPSSHRMDPKNPNLAIFAGKSYIQGLQNEKEDIEHADDNQGLIHVINKFTNKRVIETPIMFGTYPIPYEAWTSAHAELPKEDVVPAAGVLFRAIFTDYEMIHCTLNGKNKTEVLDQEKQALIFRVVGFMKNNHLRPFPEVVADDDAFPLTAKEKKAIRQKIFTDKRNQISRELQNKPPNGQTKRKRSADQAAQQKMKNEATFDDNFDWDQDLGL